eukprot:360771-Chlamydomonas_euryale.AAC.7
MAPAAVARRQGFGRQETTGRSWPAVGRARGATSVRARRCKRARESKSPWGAGARPQAGAVGCLSVWLLKLLPRTCVRSSSWIFVVPPLRGRARHARC